MKLRRWSRKTLVAASALSAVGVALTVPIGAGMAQAPRLVAANQTTTTVRVKLQSTNGGFFTSPSTNISCELDNGRINLHQVYCQTFRPAESVTLSAKGALRQCKGDTCLGNPPDNAFVLHYGDSTRSGPFACLSTDAGITCTVTGKGGFRISKAGIVKVKQSLV